METKMVGGKKYRYFLWGIFFLVAIACISLQEGLAAEAFYEVEENNSLGAANRISVNQACTGNIQTGGDVDYYKVELRKAGKMSVVFQHDEVTSGSWYCEILDAMNGRLNRYYSGSKDCRVESDELSLQPGTYYVKVYPCTYNDADYCLTAYSDQPVAEPEIWEDRTFSTPVSTSKRFTIVFSQDLDFITVNTDNIYVAGDKSGNNKLEGISLNQVTGSARKLEMVPLYGGWQQGLSYYLLISQGVRSSAGKNLNQGIRMSFTVQEPVTETVFTANSNTYTMNGTSLLMDTCPYLKSGELMVPVRHVSRACGVRDEDVVWDAATQSIVMMKGDKVVQLTIGGTRLIVNGVTSDMSVAPEIVNDRVYVPARYVAEAFAFQVLQSGYELHIISSVE